MIPSFDITPAQPKASQALLRERLAQLEAALLEARGRVVLSFDRELASLRGWMDSLEHFDPTIGLQALQESAASPDTLEELLAAAPPFVPANVVPFSTTSYCGNADVELESAYQEQPLDPVLASATLDELNAALAAAFEQMAEKCPPLEPRSA